MRILTIPDPHQSTAGLEYAKTHIGEVDKVIVLGDFCDEWESAELWNNPQRNPINLMTKWIEFQTEHADMVDLNLGNHDFAYISGGIDGDQVSGHQHAHHGEIGAFIRANIEHFKVAEEYDGWVFSHAGISHTYFNRFVDWFKANFPEDYDFEKHFVEALNRALIDHVRKEGIQESFCFNDIRGAFLDWNGSSPSGDDPINGPTWIRPNALVGELRCNRKPIYPKQIFGHTEIKTGTLVIGKEENPDVRFVCIDSPNHDNFLTIDTSTYNPEVNKMWNEAMLKEKADKEYEAMQKYSFFFL